MKTVTKAAVDPELQATADRAILLADIRFTEGQIAKQKAAIAKENKKLAELEKTLEELKAKKS